MVLATSSVHIEPREVCEGSGRAWLASEDAAVCPVCHLTSRALGVTRWRTGVKVAALLADPAARVPEHPHRLPLHPRGG